MGCWCLTVRDSLTGKGVTPLTRASSCRADDVVSALIASRASPNASRGCSCLIQFLLKRGLGRAISMLKLETCFFFLVMHLQQCINVI